MNPFNYYVTLKIAIKKQNKEKEVCLKYAKPCNPWRTIYIYIYISTILQNKEEKINLINKIRVGVNSTLKVLYKNKKEDIVLEN